MAQTMAPTMAQTMAQTMATAEAASETPGTPAGPAASIVDNAAADGPVSTTESTVAALAIRLIAGQTQLRRAIGPLRDSVKGLAHRVETLEELRAEAAAPSPSPMLGPLPEHETLASIDGTVVPDPFVANPRRAARHIERATSGPVRRSRRWLSGAATATFLLAVAGSAAWLTGARPPVQFSWTPQPEPAALQTPASPSVILPIEVRRPAAPRTPDDVAALPAPPVAPAPRNLDSEDAARDAALSITPAAGPADTQAPPPSRLFAAARTDPNNGNGTTEPRPQPTNATSLAVGTHPAPRPAAPPAAEPAPAVEPAAAAVDVIRPAAGPAADPSGQQALTQPPAAPGPAETTAPPAADDSLLARLRHLADSGDHSAQYDLAVFYLQGSEVEQDYAAAALWLERAAKGGLAQAQYNLGVMLDQGLGAPTDPVRAVGWFGLAADQGHARAQYALAIAYAEGRGAGRDLPLATEWLQLAADQGLADAQYALGVIREEGLATAPDLAEA